MVINATNKHNMKSILRSQTLDSQRRPLMRLKMTIFFIQLHFYGREGAGE